MSTRPDMQWTEVNDRTPSERWWILTADDVEVAYAYPPTALERRWHVSITSPAEITILIEDDTDGSLARTVAVGAYKTAIRGYVS